MQKHVEEKLECAQGIMRKGGMRQLKASWPWTELSNRVRVLCFRYRPPKQEAKLDELFRKNWKNSSLVQLFLEYFKDNFCVQVLDGLIWYVLCGICSLNKWSSWRVWSLVSALAAVVLRWWELKILREVRRSHGRIITLDLSRGDFGEGRVGKGCWSWSWWSCWASRRSLLKAWELQQSPKFIQPLEQGVSWGDC